MNDLMLKMKTVANMENDMERWLQDRDRISKQLEGCQKKREEAARMKRVRKHVQNSVKMKKVELQWLEFKLGCVSSFYEESSNFIFFILIFRDLVISLFGTYALFTILVV